MFLRLPAYPSLGLKRKKKQNRLALEQLDLQVQKLLADTSVLIDKKKQRWICKNSNFGSS
jgi:hypothetical protein